MYFEVFENNIDFIYLNIKQSGYLKKYYSISEKCKNFVFFNIAIYQYLVQRTPQRR